MLKKKKIVLIIILLLVGIVFGIYFMFFSSNVFEGRYYSVFLEFENYYEFIPDKNNPNEGECNLWHDENDADETYIGRYKIKDGKVIIEESSVMGENTVYKNYLIPEKYMYEGFIPEKKKFDTICSYVNDEGVAVDKIIFKSDGTLEEIILDEEETRTDTGTYERKGDIIKVKIEGSIEHRYYIYKNQINDSVLYKK